MRDGKEREKLGTPCPSCKTNIPFGTMRCPRCREWNFSSSDENEQEVVRLSDARISIVPRLPTLHPQMDIFFGGGLVQTSTMLLGAEPGFGKDLALDTPIPTPTGWTTMGEIKVGDSVFDEEGVPCTVIAKSKVMRNPCYSLGFDSGERIVAGQDHEWFTLTRRDRMRIFKSTPEFRAHVRATRKDNEKFMTRIPWNLGMEMPITRIETPRRRTTKEIAESLIVGWDARVNHSIKLAADLKLPEVPHLEVDPYLLGLWLGDGHTGCSRIGMMASDFEEVLQHVTWPIVSKTIDPRSTYKQPYMTVQFGMLARSLRRLGILKDKRIPPIYLRASVEQRRELLRGLLDTDGTCSKLGHIEIALSKRDLIEDVAELVYSLSLKGAISIRPIQKGSDSHRLKFTANFPCFKLPRKLVRQNLTTRSTTRSHYIVSAESVPTVPTACIQVDSPNSMYLVGRTMVPTHNSTLTLQLADFIIGFFLRERGEKRNVVMVANEQSPDEIRAKAIEIGIVHMHEICVIKAMGGFSGNLFEIISRYKPCLTVIDSLSKLVGRDPDLAVIVASMMKELSVKLNMPTLMINQVTKDLNHAGQEKLQHEVDMTALGTTIGNKRILESEKNRNGQAPLALAMQMKEPEDFARGEGGLTIMGIVKPPNEEDEDEDDEPVARIGEEGENVPGPKRLKQ